jgi:dTDP-4-amino-4,6-dideoxygalactose transaminase
MQPVAEPQTNRRGERTRRLFLSPPHMSGKELDFIRQAFDSNYIALLGPMVEAFERELADELEVPHVLSTASGTAAIHLALRCIDIQPGDEIWASTLTFIGSVAPIVYERARPAFIDADSNTWTLDPDLLSEALAAAAKRNELPKAILPTDLYGQSCDLDAIVEVSAKYGIPVICDSAEAMGTIYRGRKAGSGALMAAYSFNGNKVITTSGGGALTSADEKLIQRARYLSTQARVPVVHYEHTEVGYNYRMSNILAAIGRAQLRVLVDRVTRRRQIFQHYVDELGEPLAQRNDHRCCSIRHRLRNYAAGARRSQHRKPPGLETDAPTTGVQWCKNDRRYCRRQPLCSGALLAFRFKYEPG